jgi:GNAT superfamily N-acetyltransferase
MYQSIHVQNNDQLAAFCVAPNLPLLDPVVVSRQKAGASWLLNDHRGDIIARCSLWWRETPPYPRHRLGFIGHYAARDLEAAGQVLTLACDQLAAQGCTLAVGPLDGNTWQRYRLLTERGSEPLFFLEPDNPDDWPVHFTETRFTPLARYFSALDTRLQPLGTRLAKTAERAGKQDFEIRMADLASLEAELHYIYTVSIASFQDNFLYNPIGEADFLTQYAPLRPYLRPELILIAEQSGRPVGFLFALPDLLQAQRGQVIDTVILKTVAVHPDVSSAGLGSLLIDRCIDIASKLGYTRAIHALMHESNDSRKISKRYEAETIRQYALFAREL